MRKDRQEVILKANLDFAAVKHIRQALQKGIGRQELAAQYGVPPDTTTRIKKNRAWKEVA